MNPTLLGLVCGVAGTSLVFVVWRWRMRRKQPPEIRWWRHNKMVIPRDRIKEAEKLWPTQPIGAIRHYDKPPATWNEIPIKWDRPAVLCAWDHKDQISHRGARFCAGCGQKLKHADKPPPSKQETDPLAAALIAKRLTMVQFREQLMDDLARQAGIPDLAFRTKPVDGLANQTTAQLNAQLGMQQQDPLTADALRRALTEPPVWRPNMPQSNNLLGIFANNRFISGS